MTIVNSKAPHALILAAGKGTRMNSDLPKVLHEIAQKPMIEYVLEASIRAGIHDITVVVGHSWEKVENAVKKWNTNKPEIKINFHHQEVQQGTGHAVLTARKILENTADYLIVLLGDVPLIKPVTLEKAFEEIIQTGASMLVISTLLDNPQGYGRIIRDNNGLIMGIREEKEANEEEKKIREINTGGFIFKSNALWKYIDLLNNNNNQKEYYLTDLVEIMNRNHERVVSYICEDSLQFQGINSPDQLKSLEKMIGISV